MAKFSSQATLFGLDLAPLWAQVRPLFSQLPMLQALARWVPPTPVQWVVDGSAGQLPQAQQAQLRAGQWLGVDTAAPPLPPTAPAALLLDENNVLQRRLHLPWLAGADLEAAVQLQAITFSPFDPQDLVYAYHSQPSTQGGLQVDMVLASKKTIENARQHSASSYLLQSAPEIWLPSPSGPVLCPGWGEQPRLQQERRQRWSLLLGALVVLVLAVLVLMTPSLQLRQTTLQAMQQTAALTQQAAPAAAQRQALMAQAQDLHHLAPQLQQQIDHLRVLAALTQVLPDDTATQRIVIEGQHLSLQGLSGNATQVQQLLSQEPGFHSVRMPSAITRDNNSNLENFVLEADLDPQIFAPWPTPAP